MGQNMKLAAEKLMKIANDLEKEAAENTFFVCESCNHTSSLADINVKRKTAGEENKVKRVACVTVNDKVSCPACGDAMSYVATEMSEKFYVEAEEGEDIGTDIFEPVNDDSESETSDVPESNTSDVPESNTSDVPESNTSDIPEAPDSGEDVPENAEPPMVEDKTDETVDTETTPEGDETVTDETSDITDYDGNPVGDESEDVGPSSEEPAPEDMGAPADDSTEEAPAEELPGEPEVEPSTDGPVVEETVPEDTAEEITDETVTDEIPSEDGDVEVPKKEVPKFEKIPKDASEDFLKAVAKYSI